MLSSVKKDTGKSLDVMIKRPQCQPTNHYEVGFTTCMRDILSFVTSEKSRRSSSPEALLFYLVKRLHTLEETKKAKTSLKANAKL